MDGKILAEKLLEYASAHLYLQPYDRDYVRNLLLSQLGESAACAAPPAYDAAGEDVPDALMEELRAYGIGRGLCTEESAERFCVGVFGLLTPLPSEINRVFGQLRNERGPQAACDWFYDLCVKNGYIQKTAVARNLKWAYEDGDNRLEITVNLSKPEKSNKDIAKARLAPQGEKYPACLLCKENEGFEGTATHPARRNLRTVRMRLGGPPWFMQYSPYAYYDEHCIVVNERHVPMNVDAGTPGKLLDFVDLLPNYFVGSNASLPIVGGSILSHEHFQGGRHLMPMHGAKIGKEYRSGRFPGLRVGILNWYNSAVQCEGTDRGQVEAFAAQVIGAWSGYDCPACDVFSHTGDTPHNAVTPICRKQGDTYLFTMILRNNRTSERYPDGIFHVHPEYLNIKSEGIGLIEAMGLFILPPRLKRQLGGIEAILCGEAPYLPAELEDPANDLYVHRAMIAELAGQAVFINDGAVAEKGQGTFHDVQKLADVAGPGIFPEKLHDRVGNADILRRVFRTQQEGGDQKGNVFAPLPQGRNADAHHGEAVVEVVAQYAFFHGGERRFVQDADDAYIHILFRMGPESAYLLFLKHAQKLGLKAERHGVELVEKQGYYAKLVRRQLEMGTSTSEEQLPNC